MTATPAPLFGPTWEADLRHLATWDGHVGAVARAAVEMLEEERARTWSAWRRTAAWQEKSQRQTAEIARLHIVRKQLWRDASVERLVRWEWQGVAEGARTWAGRWKRLAKHLFYDRREIILDRDNLVLVAEEDRTS